MTDEPAGSFLRSMSLGIERRADLLAAVLPRVAPEATVVACAVEGLLRDFGEDWSVQMEVKLAAGGKCDMVITQPDGGQHFFFEWKLLWPKGVGECIGGIAADLKKLSGANVVNGYAVAFAYALTATPPEGEERRAQAGKTLASAIDKAKEKLGPPIVESPPITIDAYRAAGAAQVLAWRA